MALRPESARVARESAVAYLAGAFERPPARVLLRRALWPNSLRAAFFRCGAGQVTVWGTAAMTDSVLTPRGPAFCGFAPSMLKPACLLVH